VIGDLTPGEMLEVAAGVAALAAGIWLYRKRGADDPRHGSQGAVLLLVLAAILLIHGLGLLDYRPMGNHL
jgi:hypothetical protein